MLTCFILIYVQRFVNSPYSSSRRILLNAGLYNWLVSDNLKGIFKLLESQKVIRLTLTNN